ncbi:RAB31, member RAS oncogene family [Turdus rufiventris]|nr:RAB31, member RAS oncogene family [Turdus rufiventris]
MMAIRELKVCLLGSQFQLAPWPPLAKAESIDGSSDSGITWLRNGKKLLTGANCSQWKEKEYMRATILQTPGSVEERDEVLRLWSRDSPGAWVQTMELATARTYGPVKRGAHTGITLLAKFVTSWRTHTGSVPEGLHPMEETVLEQLDTGVGKSSIVCRFVQDHFDHNISPTIGASFMTKTVPCGNELHKFLIWDTAGQERFHSLAPMYYRGSAAAVIVYDITKQDSFHTLKKWVKELKEHGPENIVMAIAGNKCDLSDIREVPMKDAKEYAESIGAIVVETSAKNAVNIEELFQGISQQIPPLDPHENSNNGAIKLGRQTSQTGFETEPDKINRNILSPEGLE